MILEYKIIVIVMGGTKYRVLLYFPFYIGLFEFSTKGNEVPKRGNKVPEIGGTKYHIVENYLVFNNSLKYLKVLDFFFLFHIMIFLIGIIKMDTFQLAETKCNDNEHLKDKIINDRLLKRQIIGTLFRPLVVCLIPALQPPKLNIVGNDGSIKPVNETEWERKSGKFSVRLIGSKKYGLPYGQDIFIIFFLASEAKRQKSRKITGDFYKNFLRMFNFEHGGKKSELVRTGFLRIKESKFSLNDLSNEAQYKKYKGENFLYIDKWNVCFDPDNKDNPNKSEQFIVLSQCFWEEIINFPIPFNLDAVIYLKRKTAHLMFYIWLSFRVWYAYHTQEFYVRIPITGKNGLQNQLSSRIENKKDYCKQVKRYLISVKEIWPKCPAEILKNKLIINVSSESQLDIPNKPKKLSLDISWPPKTLKSTQKLAAANSSPLPPEIIKKFNFYGSKGSKLKAAMSKPLAQIERNLVYFEVLIKRKENTDDPVKNPGAFLCDCILKDYAQQSQFDFEREQKKAAIQRDMTIKELAIKLTKEKRIEFSASIDRKIMNRLSELLPIERQKLESDFEDLVTQQTTFSKIFKSKGLKDNRIKAIYHCFMGEKFLSEEELDFEEYMSSQGLKIVED
jgi:hypothetical protein